MKELKVIQAEVLPRSREMLLTGVLNSLNIIDSSANVLHSQMSSALTTGTEARRASEYEIELAIQCGKGIAELIRAKVEMLRLLKK